MRRLLLCSLCVAGLIAHGVTQELKGASEALREAKAAADAKRLGTDPAGAFKSKLDAYRKASSTMDAAQAAAGWLELFTAYEAANATSESRYSYGGGSFSSLIEVLPQPEAWPQIAKVLKSKTPKSKTDVQPAAMALLAEMLVGTPDSQWKEMAKVMAATQGSKDPVNQQLGMFATSIYQSLANRTGDKERMIRAITMPKAGYTSEGIILPDLVGLVGKARATQIISDLLKTSTSPIAAPVGKETQALMVDLAIKNIATMKVAQWGLAIDPSSAKLYEAMMKRFGAPKPATAGNRSAGSETYKSARFAYLMALLKQNRMAEATKIATQISSKDELAYISYYNRGYVETLANSPAAIKLFEQVVRAKANSPFWDLYIPVATRAGTIGKVIESLQAAAAKPNLKGEDLVSIQDNLVAAYLANDQVDPAIALLRQRSTGTPNPKTMGFGIKIATIGHLLKRKAWVDEGLAIIRKSSAVKMDEYSYSYSAGQGDITDLLVSMGLAAEAERLLIDQYAAVTPEMALYPSANASLIRLTTFYHGQNRPNDVRLLLDQAPNWGLRDAADLVSTPSIWDYESGGSSAGMSAAWALAKTGKEAEALKLVYRLLAANPASDEAYGLLIDLAGPEAIGRLDAIYSADPFEERPLIWKAVLLMKQGNLEEAEKVSRQAISIDPSDGETKNGRRLFAYSVLADIREARGDKEDAANLRQAVSAIRLAEEADKFLAQGMIRRSTEIYKEALGLFSNAYCIQSRLAIQLMEQGRVKEAEEHYRRAYELMPESFGRVETHCFGCEQAFEGEVAQNIAEQVFAEFAAKNPKKPQIHYLLGHLRMVQGRYSEALTSFRKAAELDPDYLNAWKQIHAMGQVVMLPDAERKKVAAALLRLDPLQRHETQHNMGSVSPAEIWRATSRATKAFLTESAGTVYPLAASQMTLDMKKRDEMEEMMDELGMRGQTTRVRTPGQSVARIEVIALLIQLIESSSRPTSGWEESDR